MINLSFFSKKIYDSCPGHWKARYIDRVSAPAFDKRMAYEGSVWHLLLENWMKKCESLDVLWLEQNLDKYIEEYLDKELCFFKSAMDRSFAREKILKMISGGIAVMQREGLIRRGLPEYSCKNAKIKGKVNINVRIDLVFNEPDFVDIYDYKGVGKFSGLSYEQLAIYRLAAALEFKKPVRNTAFIMGLFAELVPYQESRWPVSRVEEEFLKVAEEIERGVFPCFPSSKSCKECVIRATCTEVYNKEYSRKLLEGKIDAVKRNRREASEVDADTFRVEL